MILSAQGVALVAWVGASVAQVEALRADLMCLDAGLTSFSFLGRGQQ